MSADTAARNARALRFYRRVRDAIFGFGITIAAIAILWWLLTGGGDEDGAMPWVGAIGCLLAGPALLWSAFRPMRGEA